VVEGHRTLSKNSQTRTSCGNRRPSISSIYQSVETLGGGDDLIDLAKANLWQ
jgi:hypothetical protein